MLKRMSKKTVQLAVTGLIVMGVLTACGSEPTPNNAANGDSGSKPQVESKGPELSGKISASGSTALQPLVSKAAQDFMALHPKVEVSVTGGGSGTGVKNVTDGVTDIGNSDVEAALEYKDKLDDNIVVLAPFALIVNSNVNVDNLTKQQAEDIFTGKVTNWSEVGGKDGKITVVHRPDSSGSRKLVHQIVLGGKDFTKEGVTQDTSKTVAEAVGSTEGSIGYVDVPYIKGNAKIKALKLDGSEYSAENIKSGKYPLYGLEHMYTKKGVSNPTVDAFLDFIMSKEFLDKPEVAGLGFLSADLVKK